jgi:cytoskeleton protein RodZ
MTDETTPPTSPSVTAGALLRSYREAAGFKVDVLAHSLRVSPAKLDALEADRLDELPDAMFARALALAVCRQLKVDAAPLLALLPSQDVSRLAPKDERGLDFPLDRPSFLPQSSLRAVVRFFTATPWAAVSVVLLALGVVFWSDMHAWFVFKDDAANAAVVAPDATPLAAPVIALPVPVTPPPVVEVQSAKMVTTTVHSAAEGASATGALNDR